MLKRLMDVAERATEGLSRRKFFEVLGMIAMPIAAFLGAAGEAFAAKSRRIRGQQQRGRIPRFRGKCCVWACWIYNDDGSLDWRAYPGDCKTTFPSYYEEEDYPPCKEPADQRKQCERDGGSFGLCKEGEVQVCTKLPSGDAMTLPECQAYLALFCPAPPDHPDQCG